MACFRFSNSSCPGSVPGTHAREQCRAATQCHHSLPRAGCVGSRDKTGHDDFLGSEPSAVVLLRGKSWRKCRVLIPSTAEQFTTSPLFVYPAPLFEEERGVVSPTGVKKVLGPF